MQMVYTIQDLQLIGGDLSSMIKKQKEKGGFFTEDQILNWFT